MRSVTIRIPAAKFSGTMTAIAEWLDVNGYEPTRYKYNHDEDAVLVTVDFSAGVAAKAFATRFDGVDWFPLQPTSPDSQRRLPAEATRHRR
jgi:phage host-nuclease inhibitor protein Gam